MRYLILMVFSYVLGGQAFAAAPDQVIRDKLTSKIPEITIENIEQSPIDGLLQVIDGAQIYYVTENGDHLIYGDLLDLDKEKKDWNLTELRRQQARLKLIAALPESNFITFSPKQTQAEVYVFTDVDCHYCRRFHDGMKQMNDLGIEVHYVAFPRTGAEGETYTTMQSIWCAKDPKNAMDIVKGGQSIEPTSCKNSVAEQYALGEKIGVRATPAIVFEDGTIIFGYLPPKRLIAQAVEHQRK